MRVQRDQNKNWNKMELMKKWTQYLFLKGRKEALVGVSLNMITKLQMIEQRTKEKERMFWEKRMYSLKKGNKEGELTLSKEVMVYEETPLKVELMVFVDTLEPTL